MLKITVIAPGKLKEKFWKDACAEYLKRLGGYVRASVRELSDSSTEKEAASILDALDSCGQGVHVILLDIQGTMVSSEQIAQKLDELALAGTSNVALVIGGSDGVTDAVCARADERISLGRITLPHNLARVVMLEQIYRACKINSGEPYHK